jgi:hypothetical protein
VLLERELADLHGKEAALLSLRAMSRTWRRSARWRRGCLDARSCRTNSITRR